MSVENVEIKERWEEFYRRYYKNEIGKIAHGEKGSLVIDYGDVEQYDPELADDLSLHPEEFRGAAEDALADFDIAADVSLESARVRFSDFRPKTGIREIRSDDVNKLIAVEGIVRKATEVRPKVLEAAFECQRCGTLTNVEQTGQEFSEPHQCRGCERQGPFRLLEDQSDFVDVQELRVQELSAQKSRKSPGKIDVTLTGDITGRAREADIVTVTGILRAIPEGNNGMFEIRIDGNYIERTGKPEIEFVPDHLDYQKIEAFVKKATMAIAQIEDRDNKNSSSQELIVREKIITPFISTLGWDVMGKEVAIEYGSGTNDYVDYQLLVDNEPAVCIEAKRLSKKIKRSKGQLDHLGSPEETPPVRQLKGYMRTTGSEYGIVTNGEYYSIYKSVDTDSEPNERIVMGADLQELSNNLGVLSLVSRDNFQTTNDD